MAEIVTQTINLYDVPLESYNTIVATASAVGLEDSESSNSVEFATDGDLAYTVSSDGTYYIVTGRGEAVSKNIVIPDHYKGLPVEEIASGAFAPSEYELNSIVIPYTMKKINDTAFIMSDVSMVTFAPDPNNIFERQLKTIGKNAFADCSNLSLIELPDSVITIGDGAFYACTNLSDVKFSTQLEAIPKNAFTDTLVQDITIPSSVKSIGVSAFENCKMLLTLKFSDDSQLETIGDNAFADCWLLKGVQETDGDRYLRIPDTVTHIGANAFLGCAFEEVYTGMGCVSIANWAFQGCCNLKLVHFGTFEWESGYDDEGNWYREKSTRVTTALKSIGGSAFSECENSIETCIIPACVTWIGTNAFSESFASDARVLFSNYYGWFATDGNTSTGGNNIDYTSLRVADNAKLLLSVTLVDKNWYRISRMVAPTISIDQNELTITDSTGLASAFYIWVNGAKRARVNADTGEISLEN